VIDIGGIGSSPDGLEIYHEGLFLPILRFIRAGRPDPAVLAILAANVRDPAQVEGDLFALVACNEVGARRLIALLREFGLSDLDALGAGIIDRSARAMQAALADWPRGTWHNTVISDGYDAPITLQAAVTVDDDGVRVDFAGSSDAVARGINVPKAYTDAYTSFGIRCLIGPDVPNNAGSLAAIRVSAPAGSIVNALHPSPVTARHVIGQLLPDVVFGALRQARLPRRGITQLGCAGRAGGMAERAGLVVLGLDLRIDGVGGNGEGQQADHGGYGELLHDLTSADNDNGICGL